MVRCSVDNCARKLFHLECVGLNAVPVGYWKCPACMYERSKNIDCLKCGMSWPFSKCTSQLVTSHTWKHLCDLDPANRLLFKCRKCYFVSSDENLVKNHLVASHSTKTIRLMSMIQIKDKEKWSEEFQLIAGQCFPDLKLNGCRVNVEI